MRPGVALASLLALALPAGFWICQLLGWPLWILGVVLLPIAWMRRHAAGARALWIVAALLAAWALLARDALPVRLYPVFVNLGFLTLFGWSLLRPPSVIERLARLREPDLPAAALPYIRKVTAVWCGFFLLNGSIALWTAVAASEQVWATYNGGIAYLMMGALFAIEWLVRQRVRRRIEDRAHHA